MAKKHTSLSEMICITVIITILIAVCVMIYRQGGIFPKTDTGPKMAIEQSDAN